MIHVKVIRHSERLDFTNPLYWMLCIGQYWSDTPLTSNGHITAKDKGEELAKCQYNPAVIYTSPYTRTLSTSTEIMKSFPQSEIIIEPLMCEYQPSYKHRIALYPSGIPTICEGVETGFAYPETYEQFNKRIRFIINKLCDKNDRDIMIVTHGEVIKCYVIYLQNMFPGIELDPGSTPYLTTLSFDYDKTAKQIIQSSISV